MAKERIETGKAPMLSLRCAGDLRVRGWTELAMLINGQSYTADENEKGFLIDSTGDLSMMVPVGSLVDIQEVSGDLAIKGLEGDLTIGGVHGDVALLNLAAVGLSTVNGDLSVKNLSGPFSADNIDGDCVLRNVFEVQLGSIHGDCAARNVNGNLNVASVSGDFAIRTINGDVTIKQSARDANFRNVGGTLNSTNIHGDIRLRGGLSAGKHQINASGDIVVLWPSETPLVVEANAPNIKCKLPLQDVAKGKTTLSGRIGDDGAVLIMNAKGRIIIKELGRAKDPWDQSANGDYTFDLGFDLADLGEQISDEITAHMTAWSLRMENDFGPEFSAKIEKKAQQAAAKAERAAARAVRQAEKAVSRSRWASRPPAESMQSSPKAAGKKDRKATEEEQLKILRMVENGLISPEEAGTLLDALEY
jgi:hypothetical protein